jgi:hypothetical protein
MVDSLVRELGSLRNEARTLDSRDLDARVAAEIERCIADAAQAIDDAISGPEDEQRLIGVCEAIVVARARIEALRATAKRSQELMSQSVELRRQGRRLYESLRQRSG